MVVASPPPGEEQDDFAEAVLRVVEAIPPGRVLSYGDIAEFVGRGGPRQVGQVMARDGGGVPWWRVVHADGSLIRGLEETSLTRLRAERTPLRGERVDIGKARWELSFRDDVRGFSTGPHV